MAQKSKLKKFEIREVDVRPKRFRKYQYLILIVCEDEKTEPSYFQRFKEKIPQNTIYLETIGTGFKPKAIIDKCIEARNSLKNDARREFDSVWAVFDKDDEDLNETRINSFNEAFRIAKSENIKIAYSNEVFELWFLLHFASIDWDKPLSRQEVYKKFEECIRTIPGYESYVYNHYKPDGKIIEIVDNYGKQSEAIQRAKEILIKHKGKNPLDANPSTRVHLLVVELNEWIEFYSFDPKGKK